MVEHDVEQGSPEWHQLRAGIPTASRFGRFLKQDLTLRDSDGSRGFAMELAAERVVGGPLSMDTADDGVMGRGHALESKARSWYEFRRDTTVRQTGIVIAGKVGGSPDGLVDDDPEGPGIVEIKNPMTKQHVRNLLGEDPASDHQVHGLLYVTGRNWCDVISWTEEPALGPVLMRVYPDDGLRELIRIGLEKFEEVIGGYERRLRIMGTRGRVGGDVDLYGQIVASVVGDGLTPDQIGDFARDIVAAIAKGTLTSEAAAEFVKGAADNPLDYMSSLKRSLNDLAEGA